MKAYRGILFALLLVLAACSQAPAPTATPEETLSSQAVLAGASGFVFYVVHNPNAAKPYSIVRYDQQADTKTVLYKGDCEIQSVAGTLTGVGSAVFMSMREPGNCGSDFEIFRITSQTTAEQISTNSSDDTNVSVTRGVVRCIGHSCFDRDYITAWETGVRCLNCLKRGIQLRIKEGSTITYNLLKDFGDLTQPSISGNGKHVAFIQKSGSSQTVGFYSLNPEGSISVVGLIASNGSGLVKPSFSAPSISDDGKKLVYLSRGIIAFPDVNYSIKLWSNFNISTVVSGVPFSHPHLTADGNWLTYAQQVNSTFRIKTRSLVTNLETDATAPSSPVSHFAPFWQKANP
jgi:WD40-like Beta Propeller Repeat